MSRIGELLIKNGIITEIQLNEALKKQKKEKHKRLSEILIELGYLNSKDLIWMLSKQTDIPFVEVQPKMLDSELIEKFPEKVLYDNNVLPLYELNDKIYIAIGDPTNKQAIRKVKGLIKKEVVASGIDPQIIGKLLDKFYLEQQVDRAIVEYEGKMN